ncbi:uncharacterized protein LOC110643153 isoform X2 [Hevea brasiliensis]|uniref:uncharacterized protein LOC110643153 isoform X2 n=1 Tax=Hevea brasiliensis TaxID=3981 RepID=UPI000B76BE30|nr:uncharacterized protein LOC110643153 isoform X2 [Hevea brasiliensis]
MEQSDKQFQYNSREPGREGFHPASQAFLLDPTSGRSTNVRLPDLNVSEVKPVLNYSIQTGEEFALEFMRDRVNHKKPLIPSMLSDPNHAPSYMELKGILSTSHTGSESVSDVSMLPLAEKGAKKIERTNLSLYEERSNHGSVYSVPQTSSECESQEFVHGFTSSMASNRASTKTKVLCSFGGTILPRPSDGKFRYVGGETRIICISKENSWEELKQKTLAIYDQAHVIKYQLPGEDLDALVSVSCDEDLHNMMEEWNEVEGRQESQKLRMFLFSMSDLEDAQFNLGSLEGDYEIQYVVAVNGMDLGSRKNSIVHGLAGSSGNNLSELDGLNIDGEMSSVAAVSVGVSTSPLTSTFQSAQPVLQNFSSAHETHLQCYHGQMMDHREAQQFLAHYPHDSSKYSPSEEIPYSTSLQGLMNQQGGLNGGNSCGSHHGQNSQTLVKEVKRKPDGSVQHEVGNEKTRPLEKAVPVNKISVAVAAQEDLHSLPSKNEGKRHESENVSSSVDAFNQVQISKLCEDDHCSPSSSTFGLSGADSVSNLIDFSYYEPSVPPQRVYYSERIPREQAEQMNRLSKSDDSHGSLFLISHSHSDITEHKSITESAENFIQSNLDLHTEHPMPTAKPLHIDPQQINDGLAQLQKYKEFADAVSQMNKTLLDSQDVLQSGFKLAVANDVDNKDSANRDAMLKADHDHTAGKQKKLPIEETRESRSGNPAASQVTSLVHHKDPVTDLAEPKLSEITGKDFASNNLGHSQLFSRTESSTNDISQVIPPVGISATKQADISIDINDRFPRDFLSEIFSRGILTEDRAGVSPMHKDGAGMSVIMENHEPKHWSYFQKLAQEEFVLKDVSLIDQDPLGTPPLLAKLKDGDQKSHLFAPLTEDGVSMGHKYSQSQLNFGKDSNNKKIPGMGGAESTVHSNFGHSQMKGSESIQFGAMMENLKSPESQYEGGKLENRNIGLPPIDISLVDFDINTLQIIKNEDLEELRELGSGTFGTVYHGKWRGSDVAIKRLKKICFTGRSSEQERLTIEFWREAEILSKLHHPNVVAFYGVVQDGPGGTLATVTEFMVDGSLRHVLLKKDRYLDRRKRLLIAMDAAFGMEYLHSKNIVHFDLKCDNLLVNLKDPQRPICKVSSDRYLLKFWSFLSTILTEWTPQVGDFGLSKIKRNTLVSGGVRGTLPWMAPELLNGGSNKVSEKVDVFSFGIVLWEILTGEEPYANMHYGAIIGGIVNNTLRPAIPNFCDPDWKRLMEQCWAPNPAARPSFTEIAGRLRIMSTAANQTKGHGHKTPK